ncbi:MAG: SDR family oxidoreductase [Clostridiales Family XIII bacterium]|jgi:nucleoside-diphosphate-sugar epimerase|nr:SDR family oxidoreductase [Clostridiales Family XIII bacterium]
MRALFIGGTGNISKAITELAVKSGWEVYLLNRGSKNAEISGVKTIVCDINDEVKVKELIGDLTFDVVANFIAFVPADIARDIRIFAGKTKQYITLSSASAYQKPVLNSFITESTPLANPYWQYSRDKIAIEELLIQEYRENGFPFTVVRPSHTYGDTMLPLAVGESNSWAVIKRILDDKPIIIHGDGTSLWTITHNSDFAKGFLGLMGNSAAIGNTFQITSDEAISWTKIYDTIGAALGKEITKVYITSDFLAEVDSAYVGGLLGDKSASVIFDNSKLKRLVPDYVCTTRFDIGVKQTVEYFLSHVELQQEDPEFDAFCDKLIATKQHALAYFKSL